MIDNSDKVKRWRKSSKERMIESMGGKCVCCDYNKTSSALEFHHLDPKAKDFSFGSIRTNPKSWKLIVEELRKCVLVCCLCHREIHAGIRELPRDIPCFNEDYVDYMAKQKEDLFDCCPVCNSRKSIHNITCSIKCAGISRGKINWNNLDLFSLLLYESPEQIGFRLGCSGAAVRKRIKKLMKTT